jgi:glucosamine--fructose-6-phosphate aminotransferase (isomerizing)
MEEVLEGSDHIEEIAKDIADARGYLFMGRGVQWPVAEEGALKLKELAYVFAEAHAGGELKHGPIALIDDSVWVVAVAPRDRHYEKMISNIAEIKARGGKVLGVGTSGDSELLELCDAFIGVPPSAAEIMPLLTIIPLHLLAYWVARQKGNDIDQPRNLAKSVTVE